MPTFMGNRELTPLEQVNEAWAWYVAVLTSADGGINPTQLSSLTQLTLQLTRQLARLYGHELYGHETATSREQATLLADSAGHRLQHA
jgi:hypothetical protein